MLTVNPWLATLRSLEFRLACDSVNCFLAQYSNNSKRCEMLHLAIAGVELAEKSGVALLKSVFGGSLVVWGPVVKAVSNVEFVHRRTVAGRRGVVFFEVTNRMGAISD